MLKFAWTQNSDYSWNQHGQQGSAQQGLAAWEWARQDTDWDRTQIRRLTDASLKRGSVRRCYSSSNQHYDTGGAETQVGRGEREEERERERGSRAWAAVLNSVCSWNFFFFFLTAYSVNWGFISSKTNPDCLGEFYLMYVGFEFCLFMMS